MRAGQVRPAVQEMFDREDFQRIDLGWAYNDAVLAALWDLANTAEPIRPPGAPSGPQLESKE